MSETAVLDTSATKTFRTTEEVKNLVSRLAALQNLQEGELLDAMVDAYLLVHSPSFAGVIAGAREVVAAKPSEVQKAIARFREVLGANLNPEQRLPALRELPSARDRLRARRAAR